jgi:YYY domain-containing protein
MPVPDLMQATAVLSWLLVVSFLQVSLWPYLKKGFGEFAFPAAFPASILLFTLVSWYCGQTAVPVQLALLPFVLLFGYAILKKEYTLQGLKEVWKWELLFLACFLFMLNIRYINPSVSYAEKFMDHAFLASIMRNPVAPPLDPWFAGGTLNVYYYMGYWAFGIIGILSGVPSNIVFNLVLPTVFALSAVSMYALGHLLLSRFRWLLLGTFLIVNPSFVFEVVRRTPADTLFWNSTRTIPNAINEYPLFSFLWGDVHPHLLGLFNQVFLVFLLVFALKRWASLTRQGRYIIAGLTALSLGAMPIINTWDVLIYAPLFILFSLILWHALRSGADSSGSGQSTPTGKVRNCVSRFMAELGHAFRETIRMLSVDPAGIIGKPWGYLLLIPPLSVLLWLPFYFQIRTQGVQGLGIVPVPTGPSEFLLVHGIFIVIFIAYLAGDIVKRPYLLLFTLPFFITGHPSAGIAVIPLVYLIARWNPEPAEILAIAGLCIITFCEFLFLIDYMGDVYYRMNTVFKFYFVAWLLMGASGFSFLGRLISPYIRLPAIRPSLQKIALAIVLICFVALPLFIPFHLPDSPHTLDGLAYNEQNHPGDAAAIAWLRTIPGNITIVEAENGDYTYFSRVSSFSGIPTVIGWPFHEYMWRGSTGWYGIRQADVRSLYEAPAATLPLMKKYNVSLIYVGDSERERYQINIPIRQLDKVYDDKGVQIYALPSWRDRKGAGNTG